MQSFISLDPSCPYEISPNLTNLFGERRLLVAVLERGIKDAAGLFDIRAERPRAEQQRAFDWMMEEAEPIPAPMSFEWICSELDIDPGSLRIGALSLMHAFQAENREHLFQHRRRSCAS